MMAVFEAIQIRQHNDRAWLAYTTASLPHLKGGFPRLSRLQIQRRDRPKQDVSQMLAVMKQWVAVTGGSGKKSKAKH